MACDLSAPVSFRYARWAGVQNAVLHLFVFYFFFFNIYKKEVYSVSIAPITSDSCSVQCATSHYKHLE